METHAEVEMLSPYVDGELEPPDRARLEAHLPACAECAEVLAALRVTIAALAALPEPEPRPEDSWALRGAIARARRRPRRVATVAMAASGVAAALVGTLVAVIGPPDDTGGVLGLGGATLESAAADRPPVVERSVNYTPDTTGELLVRNRGRVASSVAPAEVAGDAAVAAAPPELRADAHAARLAECEASSVLPEADTSMLPIEYEAALFQGTPAYLLVYMVPADEPTRLELWVLARADCSVLHFGQQAV